MGSTVPQLGRHLMRGCLQPSADTMRYYYDHGVQLNQSVLYPILYPKMEARKLKNATKWLIQYYRIL